MNNLEELARGIFLSQPFSQYMGAELVNVGMAAPIYP